MDYQILQSFQSDIDFSALWLRMKKEQGVSKKEFEKMSFYELKIFSKDLEQIYKNRKTQQRRNEESVAKQKSMSKKYRR